MEGSVDAEGVHNYTMQMLLPHHKLQPSRPSVKWGTVTFLTSKPLMIYPRVAYRYRLYAFGILYIFSSRMQVYFELSCGTYTLLVYCFSHGNASMVFLHSTNSY